MSMRGSSSKRTVCEVLRVINDHHQADNEHDAYIRKLLAEAEQMTKKMSNKLKEYNMKWDAGFWEANPDHRRLLEERLKETYCTGDINES